MKIVSEKAEKNAYRLRILSVAQNLAIKSVAMSNEEDKLELKSVLALQAQKFNKKFDGKSHDIEIYKSLFLSTKSWQNNSKTISNFHTNSVLSIAFSPFGCDLVSCSNDGQLIITNSSDYSKNTTIFPKQLFTMKSLQYDSVNHHIYCTNDNHEVVMFDVKNPNQKPVIIDKLVNEITSLVLEGNYLYYASLSGQIIVYDTKSNSKILNSNLPNKPLCMFLSNEKNLLFIGCNNGTVNVLDKKSLQLISTFNASKTAINTIAYNHSKELLTCGNVNGQIIIFKSIKATDNPVVMNAHKAGITKIVFNKNGSKLASSSLDGTIKIWDVMYIDDAPLTISDHETWVYDIAFSPDGKYLSSAGKNKTIRNFVVNENDFISFINSKTNKKLDKKEWELYIGSDIPYEP